MTLKQLQTETCSNAALTKKPSEKTYVKKKQINTNKGERNNFTVNTLKKNSYRQKCLNNNRQNQMKNSFGKTIKQPKQASLICLITDKMCLKTITDKTKKKLQTK